ncbi:holo-ACP synthase [Naumannella sp. ID2617S]|uniref:Holo-[acyl-carrier-protein] synthase n=1 Tax=Enemella dayhoffiae TaxID=2016507 RepID=A0A255HCC8_9ACTN|nr:holo-ACP synthase [Enemella dayhoffiae]NNG18164.1 holo-ACP synthase [Naumannella sp. ID2617S]OYO23944.1 holo-ACP synthase [Enemella dayhoffiae]
MIIGIGVDVCEVARFQRACERRSGFARRFLTETEAALPVASMAARYAAKEALAKALRIERGLGWQDAEVVVDEFGRPDFRIRGSVAARADELGVRAIHLSLSHDAGIATAFVVCEG